MKYIAVPLLLICTLLALPAGKVAAQKQEPKKAVNNAALFYWQAFSALPKIDEKQLEEIDSACKKDTVSDEIKAVLDQCQASFQLTEKIDPKMKCEWALVLKGPMTSLPHLAKGRTLAKLLTLQGRRCLEEGQPEEAVGYFTDALLIGRNMDEGAIVCGLVGISIERGVIDCVRSSFDGIDKKSARLFLKNIKTLPNRVSPKDCINYERVLFVDWMKVVLEGKSKAAVDQFKEFAKVSYGGAAGMLLSKPYEKKVRKDLEILDDLYRQLAAHSEKSGKKLEKGLKDWKKKTRNANISLSFFLPSSQFIPSMKKFDGEWKKFIDELKKK